MKVVVTGSSGRVGHATAAALRDGPCGAEAMGAAAELPAPAGVPSDGLAAPAPRSAPWRPEVVGIDTAPGPFTTHRLDLADAAAGPALQRLLDGATAVVHVAALHAPHVGQRSDAEFERVNVLATLRLWQLAQAAGVRAIVFTSTTALYGAGAQALAAGRAVWVDEDTPTAPQTVYHRSKRAAEQALQAAAAGPGAPALRVLRMGRCFAEPAPVLVAHRLTRGIDVRDVARGHVAALVHALRPGAARSALHVLAAATPFTRADLPALWHEAPALLRQRVPALARAYAARGWALPARIDRVHDAARAQAELGWQPRHGWADALRDGVGDGAVPAAQDQDGGALGVPFAAGIGGGSAPRR